MARVAAKLRGILRLLARGDLRSVIHRARGVLWSEYVSIRLERDLSVSWTAPEATMPIEIRELADEDVSRLLDLTGKDLTAAGRRNRERRVRIIAERIPTAYVAVTSDGTPCFLQWLIGADQNDRIQAFWRGEFPRLAPDEALFEAAFTPEIYRRRGIMSAGLARIAERAIDLGARRGVTFVTIDNLPSLKGVARAGFVPVSARRIVRRGFRRIVVPMEIPPEVWRHIAGPTPVASHLPGSRSSRQSADTRDAG